MAQCFRINWGNMPRESLEILRGALERRLGERGCALSEQGFTLDIAINGALREGEYIVTSGADRAKVEAGEPCGAFAGIGAFLMASRFDGAGAFFPAKTSLRFAPERPIRGLYFATHFHNFYHTAPLERVYEQIEDAALRGCNAIAVWYDMHHYTGIDEPASRAMIERLKKILRHAREIGMHTLMTMLSNEAFAGTSERLRASSRPINGYKAVLDGHFGVEICPSKPGGIEEIMRQRRVVLREFVDVRPDYVVYWPYDQGGCTCEKCAPWGTNGFLRLFPYYRRAVEEEMPGTRIVVSTWYFDLFIDGEWEEFHRRLEDGELPDTEFLMDFFPRGKVPACIARKGLPAGKKLLAFPEISMYGGKPWGGFGANPLPAFFQESNDRGMGLYSGMMCYSEGIFEDINKAIMLDACSGRQPDARASIEDYARFEFCMERPEDVVRLCELLEQTLPRTETFYPDDIAYVVERPENIRAARELAECIDATLPGNVRQSWRWRILYLRALIDDELQKGGWRITPECDALLNELERIYCVCPESLAVVCPPTRELINRRCTKRMPAWGGK